MCLCALAERACSPQTARRGGQGTAPGAGRLGPSTRLLAALASRCLPQGAGRGRQGDVCKAWVLEGPVLGPVLPHSILAPTNWLRGRGAPCCLSHRGAQLCHSQGWPGEAQWLCFRSRTDIQTGLGQRVISNQTKASRTCGSFLECGEEAVCVVRAALVIPGKSPSTLDSQCLPL